jgi:hypothetical protein
MTLSHLVNPSQRWRLVRGLVPSCPVGTIVALNTTGMRLEVGRPWFGVVAQLDLRTATINASSDGHELTIGTATGEVVFQNDDALTAASHFALSVSSGAGSPLDPASFVGQVVQFGAIAPNVDGWNLFAFLVLRRVNGWLIGLTQAGHAIGIAEHNIAWLRVLDPGPRRASDRLVLTYVGQRNECDRAFQAEAPTLQELGYEVTNRHFRQEPRSTAVVITALLLGLLLALLIVGIAILAWLIHTKPPGILTVTLHRVRVGAGTVPGVGAGAAAGAGAA